MGKLENSEPCVPPSTRKLRKLIPAVPDNSRGNDSCDEMSDNNENLLNQTSQLRKNRPSNSGKKEVTLTAIQKYNKEYKNLNRAKLKQCAKDYYARNRERILEKAKQYNFKHKDLIKDYLARNKERILERQRKYRSKHKDFYKDYYAKNQEKLKEKKRKYLAKNREIINEKRRKYRAENREKANKQRNEYVFRNKEKIRAYRKAYYERSKERAKENAQLFYQLRSHQAKRNENKSLRLTRKINPILRSDLKRKPSHSTVMPRIACALNGISPVLKPCFVLLEKLNTSESSLKRVELNNLGVLQTPRKPKLPETITKKSFANEGCSKLAGRLIENRKNCMLVESSERGIYVQELIVKSDTAYLQKVFLEVEKMLGV